MMMSTRRREKGGRRGKGRKWMERRGEEKREEVRM